MYYKLIKIINEYERIITSLASERRLCASQRFGSTLKYELYLEVSNTTHYMMRFL